MKPAIKPYLLNHKYFAPNADEYFSGDITFINDKHSVLLFVDLASRVIVGHAIKDTPFTSHDVISLIETLLEERKSTNQLVINFDNKSIFHSQKLYQFAEENNIRLSCAPLQGHGNQVSERLNSKFKKYLGTLLTRTIRGILYPNPTVNKKNGSR